MPLAVHEGGPAHGARVEVDQASQVRYHAPIDDRATKGWVRLARYVFVPPRVGRICRYHWSGYHDVFGPARGAPDAPEWS